MLQEFALLPPWCSRLYVQANGFSYADSHAWANLGQGAPEVGPIPNSAARPSTVTMPVDSLEYAPTTGVKGNIALMEFTVIPVARMLIITLSPTQLCGPLWPTSTMTPTAEIRRANTPMRMCVLCLVGALAYPASRLLSEMSIPSVSAFDLRARKH
jgi:hypothetical protein